MSGTGRTRRAGKSSATCLGVLSGYVLKLVRESLGLTQVQLAELHDVDVASIQGWESGRRPLTALRTADLTRLRVQLVGRGAPMAAFDLLREAMEADLLVSGAVDAADRPSTAEDHLLGGHVHRRDLNSLITWPFTGDPPMLLTELAGRARVSRRGPVPDRPQLTAEERTRFFDHMLVMADSCRGEGSSLLRRQAVFLLGYDDRPRSRRWLHDEQRRILKASGKSGSIGAWVEQRSAAVAVAHNGDGDALQGFIKYGLIEQQHQQANLAYWAYWVGEIATVQSNDGFLAGADGCWAGTRLFDHLLDRLGPDHHQVDLNAHTLGSLVLSRPAVAVMPTRRRDLCLARIDEARSRGDLGSAAREMLTGVAYALKLHAR